MNIYYAKNSRSRVPQCDIMGRGCACGNWPPLAVDVLAGSLPASTCIIEIIRHVSTDNIIIILNFSSVSKLKSLRPRVGTGGVLGAVPLAAVMGARRIFLKKLATFLVVTLKTQVFTVTTNEQNTSHFKTLFQRDPWKYFSKGAPACVRRRRGRLCRGTVASPSLLRPESVPWGVLVQLLLYQLSFT